MRRSIVSGLTGNIVEMISFIPYVFLIEYISQNFFPTENKFVSEILVLGGFAVGFIARPVGAIFFGSVADLKGRKHSLIHSILIIVITSLAIGLLPTYKSIGILAPFLLLLMRFVQGIALGGQQTSVSVHLSELLGKKYLGGVNGIVLGSIYFGVLISFLLCVGLQAILSKEDLYAWGWRVPFLLSVPLSLGTLWLRVSDASCLEPAKLKVTSPLIKPLFTQHKKALFAGSLFTGSFAIPVYLLTVTLPTIIGDSQYAFMLSAFGLFLLSISVCVAGFIADKVGHTKITKMGCMALLVMAIPIFRLLEIRSFMSIGLAQVILCFIIACLGPTITSRLITIFPPNIRVTGVSLAFNLGMSVLGGTTPVVIWSLLSSFGFLAGGIYLSLFGLISTSIIYAESKQSTSNGLHYEV